MCIAFIRKTVVAGATAALVSIAVGTAPSLAQSAYTTTLISAPEWSAYTQRYLEPDGRIVDVQKGRVTHSEGQGYGMLLAVYANDEPAFRRIMNFTFQNMRGRSDGLISWLYDPSAFPRIADRNNASDGDILIAYALVKAAVRWNDASYLTHAMPLIDAIGRHLLVRHDDLVLLRPAAFGFGARHHEDGPVINLSYFIYGAFPLFAEIDSRHPWIEAWQSGLMLTVRALAGREALAPDWITMRPDRFMAPAYGFAKKSSYDAVRIPLYMMLGGRVPPKYLGPFDAAWNIRGNGAPLDYDLAADRKIMDMNDRGYRAIAALTACALRGVPLPSHIARFRPTTYFASSLHLLTLAAARAHYPECVPLPSVALANVPAPHRYRIPNERALQVAFTPGRASPPAWHSTRRN